MNEKELNTAEQEVQETPVEAPAETPVEPQAEPAQ